MDKITRKITTSTVYSADIGFADGKMVQNPFPVIVLPGKQLSDAEGLALATKRYKASVKEGHSLVLIKVEHVTQLYWLELEEFMDSAHVETVKEEKQEPAAAADSKPSDQPKKSGVLETEVKNGGDLPKGTVKPTDQHKPSDQKK